MLLSAHQVEFEIVRGPRRSLAQTLYQCPAIVWSTKLDADQRRPGSFYSFGHGVLGKQQPGI